MVQIAKRLLKRNSSLYKSLRLLYINFHMKKSALSDLYDNIMWERVKKGLTPYGFSMAVRNHPANQQMLSGDFEREETAIIQDEIGKADVFVDVGANIGFYSCMALQRKKYVIAIEPQKKNLTCLYETFELNGWKKGFEIYPVGLGEHPGLENLYGASGPSASLISNWAQYSNKFKQKIPITQLDFIVGKRFLEKNIFIKIDVEGFEYFVLCGAKNTLALSPSPIWLVEICLEEFHPSGINPNYKSTFELFWRNGYEARTADKNSQLIQPDDINGWIKNRKSKSGTFNYIFRPIHS